MPNNVMPKYLLLGVAFLFAAGCSHRESASRASLRSGPTAVQPTSGNNSNRVYETQSNRQEFVPAYAAPQGVDSAHWALAEQIRELLISDRTIAPYPSEVTVVLDSKTNGLVHVRGNIINTYERRKLRTRLEQLPGVNEVDDQTVVGLRNPEGGADLRQVPGK